MRGVGFYATQVDDTSSEILKALPWRAVQKIMAAFNRRYLEYCRKSIDTWILNVILLAPKMKGIENLEGPAKGCAFSVCWPRMVLQVSYHFAGH